MGLLFIYVIAVLVSIVFERQERRHRFEESLEYLRMGKQMPEPKPKHTLLESWLSVGLGVLIALLGVGIFWTMILVLRLTPKTITDSYVGSQFIEAGVFIAAGIALIIRGTQTIKQHHHLLEEEN